MVDEGSEEGYPTAQPGVRNLFRELPSTEEGEVFELLAAGEGVRVERITSRGHSSPEDQWYDQRSDEWVVVLRGRGIIVYEDGATVELSEGDWLHLPARCRHRVHWTDPEQPTLWLAVHFPGGDG